MFASLFKLFGCSGQTGSKEHSSESDTLNETIKSTIHDFANRPIHKNLTGQIIDTTSDAKLLQIVVDNLTEKLPEDYTNEYQTVLGWTKSQQAIYIIWSLEAEVNNGGYNQFYVNSSGQFAELAPEALKLIGAFKFSDLTARANKLYKKENDKIIKHQDGTLKGFSESYDDNPLNKIDDEFYSLYKKEDLYQLQIDYIRNHKEDFINY